MFKRIICIAFSAVLMLSVFSGSALAYMPYTAEYDFGDVNNDGSVAASDALLALQCAVYKITLDYDQQDAADTDENWLITAADALLILQHSVGKIVLEKSANVYEEYEYKYVEPTGLEAYKMYQISSGTCFTNPVTKKDYDLTRLAVSIQGLINRNNDKHHVAVTLRMDETDDFWLQYMMQNGATYGDYQIARISDTATMLETFQAFMTECGIVAWDPNVPSTANVAATICGLYNYLPVQYSTEDGSLYKVLTEQYNIPEKMSLVGMFDGAEIGKKINSTNLDSTGSPKCDAYIWAIDQYMDQCNPELLAYTLDGASSVLSNPVSQGTDAGNAKLTGIPNHDYFILRQCFFFDLTSYAGEAPSDEPNQPLGADAATLKKILQKRYDMAGSDFGMVLGFPPWHVKYTNFVPGGTEIPPRLEWHFVELCGSYNSGIEADAANPCWMSNGSLYTKYERRYESKGNAPAKEITFDPDTYYYTQSYAGDFDCSPWLKWRVPTVWRDDNLHNVEMTFNYSTTLIDRIPMAFDFIFQNQSEKQYLTAGEGAAYVMTSSLFQGFVGKEFNPDYAKMATEYTGTTYDSVVNRTLPSGDRAYIHYLKPYLTDQKLTLYGRMIDGFSHIAKQGMALHNYLTPDGTLLHSWIGNVMQFQNVPFLHVDGMSGTTNDDRVVSLRQRINTQETKFLAYGYFNPNTNFGTPTSYKEFCEAFDEYIAWREPNKKYQRVDIQTFFALLSESGRGTIIE